MMIIKKYWNKFLDWEGTEVTFDRGWVIFVLLTALAVVLK